MYGVGRGFVSACINKMMDFDLLLKGRVARLPSVGQSVEVRSEKWNYSLDLRSYYRLEASKQVAVSSSIGLKRKRDYSMVRLNLILRTQGRNPEWGE